MDRERLEQIGKFLNDRLIIHRNVENNTSWTTEEKMLQELYDNYLDILIKYKEQKEYINKEEFIDLKMKLSKEDIIYDYYATEEKLIEKLGIEHENYELKKQCKKQKEVIDRLENKIKLVKQYDFDKVGRYELLDILKEVSE